MRQDDDGIRHFQAISLSVKLKGTYIRRESAREEPFQVRRQRDKDVALVRGHSNVHWEHVCREKVAIFWIW